MWGVDLGDEKVGVDGGLIPIERASVEGHYRVDVGVDVGSRAWGVDTGGVGLDGAGVGSRGRVWMGAMTPIQGANV